MAFWVLGSLPETAPQGWCRAGGRPHSRLHPWPCLTFLPQGRGGTEWAWPLSWRNCSCSRIPAPPPSQHTKALSFPARGLDCVSPESESSYEGSASLPERVCECVCAHMHAHVLSLRELGPLSGQTLFLPPEFGLAHPNLNPLCVDECACVFVRVRVCVNTSLQPLYMCLCLLLYTQHTPVRVCMLTLLRN